MLTNRRHAQQPIPLPKGNFTRCIIFQELYFLENSMYKGVLTFCTCATCPDFKRLPHKTRGERKHFLRNTENAPTFRHVDRHIENARWLCTLRARCVTRSPTVDPTVKTIAIEVGRAVIQVFLKFVQCTMPTSSQLVSLVVSTLQFNVITIYLEIFSTLK